MSFVLDAGVAFMGGAVFEGACVFWVKYSESGRPFMAALVSMLCAVAQVAGIGESVSNLKLAPFFVLGYGVGTYAAVRIKDRERKHPYRDPPV